MSTSFNPYRKWLGIPERELPAHHYRLLGLEPFESEPAVISSSVDRQINHLKSYRGGEHARLAEVLIEEIRTAGRCLLTPEMKSIYDCRLRERLTTDSADEGQSSVDSEAVFPVSSRPIPIAVPVSDSSDGEVPEFSVSTAGTHRPARRHRSRAVGIAGHILAPLLGLSLGYVILVFAIDKQYDFLGVFKTKPKAGTSTSEPDLASLSDPKRAPAIADQDVVHTPDAKPPLEPPLNKGIGAEQQEPPGRAAQPNAPEVVTFKKAERDVWLSLEKRDLAGAKKFLATARTVAVDEQNRNRYEGLRFLVENVEQATQAINVSLGDLKPGDELKIREQRAIVVQSKPASLRLRANGKEYRYDKARLPLALALAILVDENKSGDPLIAQWAGALHLTHPEGSRAEVQRLWTQANRARPIPPTAMEMIQVSSIPKGDAFATKPLFPASTDAPKVANPAKAAVIASAVDLPPAGPQLVELTALPRDISALDLLCLEDTSGQPSFRVVASATQRGHWLVQSGLSMPPPSQQKPIARFVVDQRLLKFRWESDEPAAAEQQLRNSILHVTSTGGTHKIALRTVKGTPPLKLQLDEKMVLHEIELEHAPPADAIQCELLRVDNITPPPKPSQSILAPGEKLSLLYEDQPAIETRVFLIKTAKAPTIRLATVFRLGKQQPMEMTIKKVNGVKDTLVNKIENMTVDLQDREQYASTTLPSKLRSAQSITINPSTPGAPVQQIKKNLAIKEIQRDMSKTDKAIAALKKGIPLAKTSLEELTKIATFGNRLDGQVMLQFRLFINIGDQELTLVSSKIE